MKCTGRSRSPVWTGGRDQRDYHFEGTRKWRVMWNVPWFGSAAESSTGHYTAMYASRYASALEVARRIARDEACLFAGIVAWHSAVYRDERLWTGSYYRNFVEPETSRRSDVVMAYQLDGQWASLFQGVGRVFPADRRGAIE